MSHAVPPGSQEVAVAFWFISEHAVVHWCFLWIVMSLLHVYFSLFLKLVIIKLETVKISRYFTQWQTVCVGTLVSMLFPCWVEEMHT